jgi:putative ABC transport system permease protein
MGAARWQLVVQFMVESLCIATVSMLIALALLELLVPVYNAAMGRGLSIDYGNTLPWLFLTTIGVGVVSGAYPAYLITRASPIDALGGTKGVKGSLFRSIMLGLQFAISTFMLATVLIVYFQNLKIESVSNMYPKSQIVTLQRVGVEDIQARHETLRNELLALPDVEQVSFSSQLPYLQNNSSSGAGPTKGDADSAFLLSEVIVDKHFLATYDIPLLQGRGFSSEVAHDTVVDEVFSANVILNELALVKLGFASPAEAINQVFYDITTKREPRTYTIIGVTPDQNFQGFHNSIKPTVFKMRPSDLRFASIRIKGDALGEALTGIESVWERVIPDYPIQSEFLEDTFGQVFRLYSGMTILLGGFALVALSLSLIGLFGLSAFMAANRTREIGIRKVMGANMLQIVQLLVWQFSIPALWALLIALPFAYFISSKYLEFFAERISMPAGVVAVAGIVAIVFAWAIVAVHAVRIARSDPIKALRYE